MSDVESRKKLDSPIFRLRRYLESLSSPLWSNARDDETKSELKKTILREFSKAEKEKKPKLEEMFGDVFASKPREEGVHGGELERPQREQKGELKRLVEKWGQTREWKNELDKFDGGRDAVLKW